MSRPEHILEVVLRALRAEADHLELPGHLPSAVMRRLARDEGSSVAHLAARPQDDPLRVDALETAEEGLIEAHLEEVDRVDFTALAETVRARLSAEPLPDEADRLVLAPEVDPELGGRPVGELLRIERAGVIEDPALSWDGFRAGVLDRIERASNEADDVLAPDRAEFDGPTVEELLRAERDDELRRREGSWGDFRSGVETRVAGIAASTGPLDERAVALLRADVEGELRALAPAFDGRFKGEVGRRISDPRRNRRSSWARTKSWIADRITSIDVGWGVGLAGVAAALALLLGPGADPRPDPTAGARAELSGEVSVDAVTFEGDVMMIPDDGMTVVVLSGV